MYQVKKSVDVSSILYILEKILHGEEADYSVHERGLTMYRLSSKLIIHNYSDRHSGTYR